MNMGENVSDGVSVHYYHKEDTMSYVLTVNGSHLLENQTYNMDYNDTGNEGGWVAGLERFIVPVIFVIVVLLGCIGNILVIIVVIRNKDVFRNTTNLFIVNLAVADLLFLVFCVPFHAVIYTTSEWYFGEFMCKFVHLAQYAGMVASIFTLVAMSLDRFLAVGYPLSTKHIRQPIVALFISIAIWAAAIAMALPWLFFYTVHYYEQYNITMCADDWGAHNKTAYYLVLFMLGYALPLIAITVLSSLLIRQLWILPVECEGPGLRGSIRAKRKVTKLVIVVVVVFFLCWLPAHAMWLSVRFNPPTPETYTYTHYYMKIFAHVLSYANSAMNPIIYAFLSSQFRKGLHRALHCPRLVAGRPHYPSIQHYSTTSGHKSIHSMGTINGRSSCRVSFALVDQRTSITAADTSV